MAGEDKDILDSIDSSNIFDEFETGELKEELNASKPKEKKDVYDYISLTAGLLSTFFWIGLFIVGGLYGYIIVQNNENLDDYALLNPVCKIIIGNTPLPSDSNCMSVSAITKKYNNELESIKEIQSKDILSLITELYKTDNFNNSKEVTFINDKSQNRLRVLDVLNDFDKLRYNYDPINMERVQCEDFEISEDLILIAKCTAYSGDFVKDIKGFDGANEKISGTSTSIANSFLNYIDKQSEIFTVIDRQKRFKSEIFFSQYTNFSKKTVFNLKLQYNNTLTNK